MTLLENQYLRVKIKHHGAELSSLYDKTKRKEYLWQADPIFWGRHAPILFPIVGGLKEDQYNYDGTTYHMKQHGLARDLPFKCVESSPTKAVFSLTASPNTRKQYPFDFELQVSYSLEGKQLINAYKVINSDKQPIYFSIGGHPAYRCPLEEGEKRSDYHLAFEMAETLYTQRLSEGIRNGVTENILNNEHILPITDTLFNDDALIFSNVKSNAVKLQKGNQTIWTFHFKGFPYLGIWSKNDTSPFICIEPWFGIADLNSHNFDFTKKEGILSLEVNQVFNCAFSIEIN